MFPDIYPYAAVGQQFTGNGTGGVWWLLMAPGVALTLVALAILVWRSSWPYMVASPMLLCRCDTDAAGAGAATSRAADASRYDNN